MKQALYAFQGEIDWLATEGIQLFIGGFYFFRQGKSLANA